MATDYFHNPLGHDEQIVAEKLGIYEYSPKPENDVNMNLRMALLKEELESSKRQMSQLRKANKPQKRETLVSGGCGCGGSDGFRANAKLSSDSPDEKGIFDNKKLLIFLVIVLAAFCVMQYFAYRNETKELMEMMCMLMQSKGITQTPAQSIPQALPLQPQSIPQALPLQPQSIPQAQVATPTT